MWKSVIVLYISFIRVFTQLPEKCNRTTEFKSRQCCIFPPFFNVKILESCGAEFPMNVTVSERKITFIKKIVWSECEHWLCVLQKYGILENDAFFTLNMYFKHLDSWLSKNPVFTTVLDEAKARCGLYYDLPIYHACDHFPHLNRCVRDFINFKCPVMVSSKVCREQEIFYKECAKYFTKR